MRNCILYASLLLLASSYPAASSAPARVAADTLDGTTFTVASQTAVPGATLKPGTYSIRVVDHLSDRVILRIEDSSGKPLTTFLGLPNPSLRSSAATGAIAWANGPRKQNALRGFAFPGGNAVEFVYAKADAVELAKINSSKVAAIDPASEGHTAAAENLSPSDLQMLTLWSLSSTRVGPPSSSEPAIQAERYQPVQEARNYPPPPPATQPASNASLRPRYSPTAEARPSPSPSPRAPASARKPALSVLPHTASNLPLAWMIAALSLLGAGCLRLRRAMVHVA